MAGLIFPFRATASFFLSTFKDVCFLMNICLFMPSDKEKATPKNATVAKQRVKIVAMKSGERFFRFLRQLVS